MRHQRKRLPTGMSKETVENATCRKLAFSYSCRSNECTGRSHASGTAQFILFSYFNFKVNSSGEPMHQSQNWKHWHSWSTFSTCSRWDSGMVCRHLAVQLCGKLVGSGAGSNCNRLHWSRFPMHAMYFVGGMASKQRTLPCCAVACLTSCAPNQFISIAHFCTSWRMFGLLQLNVRQK